jgi:hypothetical protein
MFSFKNSVRVLFGRPARNTKPFEICEPPEPVQRVDRHTRQVWEPPEPVLPPVSPWVSSVISRPIAEPPELPAVPPPRGLRNELKRRSRDKPDFYGSSSGAVLESQAGEQRRAAGAARRQRERAAEVERRRNPPPPRPPAPRKHEFRPASPLAG